MISQPGKMTMPARAPASFISSIHSWELWSQTARSSIPLDGNRKVVVGKLTPTFAAAHHAWQSFGELRIVSGGLAGLIASVCTAAFGVLFNGTRNPILRLACTAAGIRACANIQADANAASLASDLWI